LENPGQEIEIINCLAVTGVETTQPLPAFERGGNMESMEDFLQGEYDKVVNQLRNEREQLRLHPQPAGQNAHTKCCLML
jgi:hypothetical protein